MISANATAMASTEPYEKDTDASEDVDLMALLLPDGTLPRQPQFSLAYNTALFDGWVKQPSPSCAAGELCLQVLEKCFDTLDNVFWLVQPPLQELTTPYTTYPAAIRMP